MFYLCTVSGMALVFIPAGCCLLYTSNKCVLGVEKAGQHAGRTDGRLPEKDCPVCAGQVNGCAGRDVYKRQPL